MKIFTLWLWGDLWRSFRGLSFVHPQILHWAISLIQTLAIYTARQVSSLELLLIFKTYCLIKSYCLSVSCDVTRTLLCTFKGLVSQVLHYIVVLYNNVVWHNSHTSGTSDLVLCYESHYDGISHQVYAWGNSGPSIWVTLKIILILYKFKNKGEFRD